jgi:hypothetical protein
MIKPQGVIYAYAQRQAENAEEQASEYVRLGAAFVGVGTQPKRREGGATGRLDHPIADASQFD